MSEHTHVPQCHARCCPCGDAELGEIDGISRRSFLGGVALGGIALTWMSWAEAAGAENQLPGPAARKPIVVKPVLTYAVPQRARQTSWRSWGGIQTEQDAKAETARIEEEVKQVQAMADFPLQFLPVTAIRDAKQLEGANDLASADVVLLYAAGGPADVFQRFRDQGKDVIYFVRHKSGPVSLWYEIVSPIHLRGGQSDQRVTKAFDEEDVVVDDLKAVLWRLRALCGLKNTMNSRIVAVGGASGWGQPKAPELAKERFKLDIQPLSYPELGELIKAARADQAAVALARRRAEAYLKLPGTSLETDAKFVENAMLLDQIFRAIMLKAECRAITVNGCMATIMPMAETTACLTLSTLNDDGYLAFCESDFVVVPSGILLSNISGLPMFLNDPTYPHDGVITLAHCTGPRKMDGKTLEPARILTHFESDYGAAPKVEMRKGQMTTNILPDFKAERWVGVLGEIVDAPFLDICRDQIDVRFTCDSLRLAQRMPGFHWMTGYGDYSKELGYALKRVGIQWEWLT
ncbi:MAG TPA: sugar isomerase [Candidatus Paceibacterota bacterium]|nr:sugar isomerase [Verrucomicrobiota bacterium]HRY46799.1 sugar isomerase [Candidatus Paceibacterota bacterium]